MIASPKIDQCEICKRRIPWKWIPAVMAAGRPLAGTGVWRSQTDDGHCADCLGVLRTERRKAQETLLLRLKLVQLLGGEKPHRQFSFERYKVASGNRLAYDRCKNFNPASENLYLWGACGVGKTHLACALARRCFENNLSVTMIPAYRLSRHARMKDPENEQATINDWIAAKVLVLLHLGAGADTAYTRQLLQEILDGRDFQNRAGLVVTSAYSLDALAQRMGDDAIASRLAGMCNVVKIQGPDFRISTASPNVA